ncbi:alpha/beta hydrolase [Parafrankia sp. BMG5.11]|uniref:alpha/beta hydrolase n=1 Tax=Parafrankia sp. BMG5.11 TaxID=222540 RepID=UPI00103E4949|nr:alpha/beta hydrolase [Parafrankia sp. BMG5.11]TCJ35338.1 alpha/beta hydrolase [Parafrankia sp. BMG5.11]
MRNAPDAENSADSADSADSLQEPVPHQPTVPAPGPQRRPEPAGRPDGGVLRLDLRIPVPATRGHDQSSQNQSSQPDGADQDGWQIAVTVCLPAQPSPSAAGPGTDGLETGGLEPGGSAAGGSGPGVPVLVGLPGGGYARRYFDLPEPGYSQAEHHVHRGAVVVMVDHLGVGESSVPPTEVTDLPTVAAAGHHAVTAVVDGLRSGTLAPGVGPVGVSAVIGMGQSMGGHILAAMQAHHRTFDGVAILGSSMTATTIPWRPGTAGPVIPEGSSPDEAMAVVLASADWIYAFFWDDVPESLVRADSTGGLPGRRTAPVWGSTTYPGLTGAEVLPAGVAEAAASIDVPVLFATGTRDVTGPPLTELAAFGSATDLAWFVAPRMAHMHNFAGTRHLLWNRLDAFAAQVTGPRTTRLW